MDDIFKDSAEEVKKILKDKKNKGAILAAGAAYLLSDKNKERNALIGGLVGYLLTKDKSEDKEDEGRR